MTLTATYAYPYIPPVTEPEPEEKDLSDPQVNGAAKRVDTVNHGSFIAGFDDGTMRPDASLTRGQAAMLLYGLLLEKTPGEAVFEDVSPLAYYYDAVNSLRAMDIIAGRTSTLFKPDEPIKRAEFVAICVKFADAIEAENKYTDVPAGYWAEKSIAAATAFGWITGRTESTFAPEAPISRAEAVCVLNNVLGRSADKSQAARMPEFTNLTPAHWAFYELLEAAVPHSYTVSDGKETWTDAE